VARKEAFIATHGIKPKENARQLALQGVEPSRNSRDGGGFDRTAKAYRSALAIT
jgi:hypothetical protein